MPFEIRFYDYSIFGKHKEIGSARVSLSNLQQKSDFDINKNGEK